jgi:hypothetical protein
MHDMPTGAIGRQGLRRMWPSPCQAKHPQQRRESATRNRELGLHQDSREREVRQTSTQPPPLSAGACQTLSARTWVVSPSHSPLLSVSQNRGTRTEFSSAGAAGSAAVDAGATRRSRVIARACIHPRLVAPCLGMPSAQHLETLCLRAAVEHTGAVRDYRDAHSTGCMHPVSASVSTPFASPHVPCRASSGTSHRHT